MEQFVLRTCIEMEQFVNQWNSFQVNFTLNLKSISFLTSRLPTFWGKLILLKRFFNCPNSAIFWCFILKAQDRPDNLLANIHRYPV